MTLPLERARSRRPVTWLTLLGVLLLPVVIGGILVAALYNPVERLDNMRAAIVNNDQPVTINGQLVPLGRQLTAGLVEGSDDLPSNLDWTISNDEDAAAGLADGTYDAVVMIPANFSAAATSTAGASDGSGGTPQKATITAQTSPNSRIVDDAITSQVASAAASVMGQQLSKTYLENVLLGFTTLNTKLADAADGAHQLADGASQASAGASQLPSGAAALASGATELGAGATQLSSGLTQLAGGALQSSQGAAQLVGGLDQVSGQLTSTAPGTVGGTAATSAQYAAQAAASTQALATTYQTLLAQNSCATPTTPEQIATCTALGQLAGGVQSSATNAGYAAGYAGGVQQALGQTAQGVDQLSSGATGLQSGLSTIAGGIDSSATGATGLASGSAQLADGATQLADGATQLSTGVDQLATGSASLAGGLDQAVAQVPTYTDQQASDLATVVADPVSAKGTSDTLFGASAIPLLAMLALWFGGLATFVALQAVPAHALTSRRPSALLALRALAPAAVVGAVQGILVALVVQLAAGYDAGQWWTFAGLAAVAGIAFAAVNQALVAVFGGAGRWISALVGVLAVATGVVSTVPGVLAGLAAALPTTPAYTAMLAALTPAGGLGAAFAGMIVWAGLAFVATIVAVARRRTARVATLLEPAPALA